MTYLYHKCNHTFPNIPSLKILTWHERLDNIPGPGQSNISGGAGMIDFFFVNIT